MPDKAKAVEVSLFAVVTVAAWMAFLTLAAAHC